MRPEPKRRPHPRGRPACWAAEQWKRLERELERGALAHGYAGDLWTLERSVAPDAAFGVEESTGSASVRPALAAPGVATDNKSAGDLAQG